MHLIQRACRELHGEQSVRVLLKPPTNSPSVAYFDNGTTQNLGKVAGGAKCAALMERLMRTKLSSSGRLRASFRGIKKLFGIPSSGDVAVLAKMVAELRTVSEATWGGPIKQVSVTAPWNEPWINDSTEDGDVSDALRYAGLGPYRTAETDVPHYLSEIHAVLAANGPGSVSRIAAVITQMTEVRMFCFIRFVRFGPYYQNHAEMERGNQSSASRIAHSIPRSRAPDAFMSTRGWNKAPSSSSMDLKA
jgi:hypothetical protein